MRLFAQYLFIRADYWVDPQEQLIGILMTQCMVSLDPIHKDFQLLAYQALVA